MELDEILSGAEPAAPAPAPEPREPEAPPTGEPADQETGTDRPRDEHGRFAPRTQDEQDAAPPAAKQEAGPIPIQALLDERDRRQRAERELEEYRRRAAPPPAPPQRPDLFEDPDGALESIRQEFRRELAAERLNYSVASAQVQYGDYGQKEAAFIEAVKAEAQNDPQGQSTLYRQMIADPNPASFAYRVGSQVLAMREIGPDPTSYKDRLVDDDALFQRMMEKRGLQPPPQPQYQPSDQASLGRLPAAAPQPVFPTSLSTARAAAPRQSAPAYTGSTPLSALGNPALKMS